LNRIHLKNVFWHPAFGWIGAAFLILNMQQYASDFDPHRLLDQMASPARREKLGPVAPVPAKPYGEDGI
jgi:hypothetical protein